ncbi:MAG: type II toxin-antitoxin system VapC family toxin [Candidatus Cloacimonetes bacterium]|nr:type II toxin-antitoxin system VapC family toxin [Candidatus Cloacimonadota bacterium]
MKYLIDTNILIAFFKNDQNILKNIDKLTNLNISVISIGELLYGAKNSKFSQKNYDTYQQFFQMCKIFDINKYTAQSYARIRKELKDIGKPIPENDIWIAAIAKENDFTIVTRDKHLLGIDFINAISW